MLPEDTRKQDVYRVLIIEDDDTIGRYYGSVLVSPLFEVELVTTIAEGVERLKARPPVHVAILDLVLPNGQGIDLVRRMQKEFPHVPVLVVTSMTNVDEEQIIMAGAQTFIRKLHLDPRRLAEAVIQSIARHRVRQEFKAVEEKTQEIKTAAIEHSQAIADIRGGKDTATGAFSRADVTG